MSHDRDEYKRGCRCAVCRADNAAREREYRKNRRGSDETPHGTAGGYNNWSCRCDACREAQMANQRVLRAKRKERVSDAS